MLQFLLPLACCRLQVGPVSVGLFHFLQVFSRSHLTLVRTSGSPPFSLAVPLAASSCASLVCVCMCTCVCVCVCVFVCACVCTKSNVCISTIFQLLSFRTYAHMPGTPATVSACQLASTLPRPQQAASVSAASFPLAPKGSVKVASCVSAATPPQSACKCSCARERSRVRGVSTVPSLLPPPTAGKKYFPKSRKS